MATSNQPNKSALRPLIGALEDHSDEGIGILMAAPARLTHLAIYVMVALVLAGLAWSFFGRADVLVMAPGTLVPASEVRRLYAPIDGELANIYIAEGQPVLKGDVVARLYARGAIEAARNALEARLKLEDAEREWKEFPQKKALLDQRVAALKEAMDTEERQHERRLAEGTSRLAAGQRAQSQEAQTNLQDARRARDAARDEAAKYERLFALPGGGGVSQLQVEGKKNALQAAENAVRVAESRVSELAARQGLETTEAKSQLETSGQQLASLDVRADVRLPRFQVTAHACIDRRLGVGLDAAGQLQRHRTGAGVGRDRVHGGRCLVVGPGFQLAGLAQPRDDAESNDDDDHDQRDQAGEAQAPRRGQRGDGMIQIRHERALPRESEQWHGRRAHG